MGILGSSKLSFEILALSELSLTWKNKNIRKTLKSTEKRIVVSFTQEWYCPTAVANSGPTFNCENSFYDVKYYYLSQYLFFKLKWNKIIKFAWD